MDLCTCNPRGPSYYVEEYDAIACRFCGKWREEKCGDSNCEYCSKQPDVPPPPEDGVVGNFNEFRAKGEVIAPSGVRMPPGQILDGQHRLMSILLGTPAVNQLPECP